ncbi:MAG: hypothetical protein U1F60_05375 [Planctomycetota bacterium]
MGFLLVPVLTGCSGGGGGGGPLTPPAAPEAPEDEPLAANALRLVGLASEAFNPTSAVVRLELDGASFDPAGLGFELTVNGVAVPLPLQDLLPNELTFSLQLADGRNDLACRAYDSIGRPLHFSGTYWCGDNTLTAQIVDGAGQPILASVDLVCSLSDDATVAVTTTTTSGSATIGNLPSRTVVLAARTADNRAGAGGGIATDGTVLVRVLGFEPPSPIANNDLAAGLAGWKTSAGSASIVAHQEGTTVSLQAVAFQALATVDNDLLVTTLGEGPQSLSRTFVAGPGTTAVTVRYRFVTSEVPGGYFGTEFNDYYAVSVRSSTAGTIANESGTMNGLGLGAFDFATGATAWRVLSLAVSPGETVQIDGTVANVGDGLFDSQLVVDYVDEEQEKVRPTLAWNATTGGLQVGYTVQNAALTGDVTITVAWAKGPKAVDRLGVVTTLVVPAGTPVGPGNPFLIPGEQLADDPQGTSHLIAFTTEANIAAVKDVAIGFAATADATVVPEVMRDIVRDGLRAAGLAQATITSTARTPADQARVMFQNLVLPGQSVAANVAAQLALYAAPGDAVIAVFVAETAGLTRDEILAISTTVQAAMVDEILELGPTTVSKHCADPSEISVVDVGKAAFPNAVSKQRFVATASPRCDTLLDEPAPNNAFHLQKNLP